jgi:hypothetical protein
MFASWTPNIDIHLHSPSEAVATISGGDPERAHAWLTALVGPIRVIKARRVAFNVNSLDRLAWLRPPANVTLDAACTAFARAMWAHSLGWKPLRVTRDGSRLVASSPRWPSGMRVVDVPWTTISALVQNSIPLNVDAGATTLFERRLKESGAVIGTAALAGSAVRIETTRPDILERLAIPALAYDGERSNGRYKVPLLAANALLTQSLIHVPADVRKQISKANTRPGPLSPTGDFPWTLYGFQASDAGRALHILSTNGGVLLAGDMGSGKALALTQKVLTPAGEKQAGDIRVGDYLTGSGGKPTRVLGVYRQGTRPLYNVRFDTGLRVRVDGEHLWLTSTNEAHWETLTTMQILERINDTDLICEVPQTDSVTYKQVAQHIHQPYETGIGVAKHPELLTLLRAQGALLTAPIYGRNEFLRGLCQQAYTAGMDHSAVNCNSKQDAEFLTRIALETGRFAQQRGESVRLAVTPHGRAPRTLQQGEACTGAKLRVSDITSAGTGEAVCFEVEAADKLFALPGGVCTHNTTVALAMVHERNLWPLLVVAPLSAFSTWDRQLGEMGKKVFLATGPASKCWDEMENGNYDAIVIAYDRLASFSELVDRLHFQCAVADEIQRVRSPGSRRSRALRSLAGSIPYRIGLSGTPLVNGLSDLLPIGAWVSPGEWKPRAGEKDLADMYPGDSAEAIADHLGTLMVRRRMEDVPTTLPKRNDHRVYVQLTKEQRTALAALEEEARQAKADGAFDDPSQRMHAFSRLSQMRKIVNNPASAGIPGPNPKVAAAIDVAQDFIAMGRKGVIFTADRKSFQEIGDSLDALGIGWVGIWGATPARQRIDNEKKFHTDPNIKVVVCTIQAGSESWSASPSATWLVTTAYVYAPAALDQMAARVYRMNSDPQGPDIEIMYIHAQGSKPTLDDRMLEILSLKRHLFSQVVDRISFSDTTNTHYSMSDLLYLMTGERDDHRKSLEADGAAVIAKEKDRTLHARKTLYKNKAGNKDLATDDGSWAVTADEWEMLNSEEVDAYDDEDGSDEESFDALEDDDR